MSRETSAVVEVDATGLACPLPVLELSKAVERAEPGTVVLLTATDPAARVDVPVWCRLRRHTLEAVEELEEGWRFRVRCVG